MDITKKGPLSSNKLTREPPWWRRKLQCNCPFRKGDQPTQTSEGQKTIPFPERVMHAWSLHLEKPEEHIVFMKTAKGPISRTKKKRAFAAIMVSLHTGD